MPPKNQQGATFRPSDKSRFQAGEMTLAERIARSDVAVVRRAGQAFAHAPARGREWPNERPRDRAES